MGICIQKKEQNLDKFCAHQPQFQVDNHKNNRKSFAVWRILKNSCQALKWPYKFHSTSSYIVVIASRANDSLPILQQDRTSLQLAEMLFGAQFLCSHLKIHKKLMLNNKQYELTIYSFYGDSEENECLARVRLTYYINKLENMLQFGAGSICLSMLNQGEPVIVKDELKQFIDFESQQYQQARNHSFFKQQLFPTNRITLKQSLDSCKSSLFFTNFLHGSNKLKHIEIKQKQNKNSPDLNNQGRATEQQMPFACEITQINIRGAKKMSKIESGNIDTSNLLFDELGINNQFEQSQKKQEFLKGLYLSTQKMSKNYQSLNQNQVKLIVNCAASVCKNWFVNDINYKWIDMPDPLLVSTKQFNIECLIYQTTDLVDQFLGESAGVLIHCSGYNSKVEHSGARSAAILIGIIMASLKISYEESLAMVNKKWKIQLPEFMNKQLKQLQKRMSEKPKGFHVYAICSYSKNFPKHLVAKYICQVQNINNIQGIDNFTKSVFICVSATQAKIMIGRQCEFKEQYQKYAKEHMRLLGKYEGFTGQTTVELIDKTFRKQPKITTNQQLLIEQLKSGNKNAGFIRNQQIVLKYPILRPVWQKKKQDCFYFIIRQKSQGAEVIMNKGMNWIGYEQDKQQFFDKIINCYLPHIAHDKIFIVESEAEKSLFDQSELNI